MIEDWNTKFYQELNKWKEKDAKLIKPKKKK